MDFFFPEAYSAIDWSKGFDFLDSELQQVTREAETGKRIVDKLVKVYLCNGKEKWLLLHIEIQNAQATKGKASQQRRRQRKYRLTTLLYERG